MKPGIIAAALRAAGKAKGESRKAEGESEDEMVRNRMQMTEGAERRLQA